MEQPSEEKSKITPQAAERKIEEKHKHIPGRGLIGDLALGLTDGVITNVAFMAGFAGAVQSIDFIRFAGIASMLAGAVSMFFGGLSSARADEDLFKEDARRELKEIELEPDEERQELTKLLPEQRLDAG